MINDHGKPRLPGEQCLASPSRIRSDHRIHRRQRKIAGAVILHGDITDGPMPIVDPESFPGQSSIESERLHTTLGKMKLGDYEIWFLELSLQR